MPQIHTYGQVMFPAYNRAELDGLGLVVNSNMWIGDGWFFCKVCKRDTPHYAMSHKSTADCFEVCRVCDNYSGRITPTT